MGPTLQRQFALLGRAALGYRTPVQRVVELPDHGRLIVGTDIQGNLKDFLRLVTLFREACKQGDTCLVVTGDLVHGPEIPKDHWPDYLGTFYRADSGGVVELAQQIADEYPGQVHFLLGNHEHAHVGGPVVSKFFPNEAARLENQMGAERAARMRDWFRGWPLVAVARSAKVLMLHGAPNAVIAEPDDLDDACLDPGQAGVVDELLADLLWARTASSARARAFLEVFDPTIAVALYGHDVAREGYVIDREPLLCVSTSFGCYDGDKVYLDWDLTQKARNAAHLAQRGLRPLWPDAEPVYRDLKRVNNSP
jgi:Calcineurin-like phosphoesterase